jgi:hypothetical protein
MFDALAALLPPSFVALDLACGPGSISQRLLGRFPDARRAVPAAVRLGLVVHRPTVAAAGSPVPPDICAGRRRSRQAP